MLHLDLFDVYPFDSISVDMLCCLQYKFYYPLCQTAEQSKAHSLEDIREVPLAVAADTSQLIQWNINHNG